MTPKLKGFEKFWREIKRLFRQVRCLFVSPRCKNNTIQKQSDIVVEQKLQNHYKDITFFVQRSISTSLLHQKTFTRFKNIHQGREIVLVATGPTARDYRRIAEAIHIGVNRAFQIKNIDLHYLFMQDYGVKPYIKEANRYKPDSCTKFYGLIDTFPKIMIPESDAIEANALRYRTDYVPDCEYPYHKYTFQFRYSIDTEPLGDFLSVIFPAVQFAFWTNPRLIYLVGCDCTEGHFDGQKSQISAMPHLIPAWVKLKEFAKVYYPETDIKSINPVGLKGIFEER